jgi:hypothetical protein
MRPWARQVCAPRRLSGRACGESDRTSWEERRPVQVFGEAYGAAPWASSTTAPISDRWYRREGFGLRKTPTGRSRNAWRAPSTCCSGQRGSVLDVGVRRGRSGKWRSLFAPWCPLPRNRSESTPSIATGRRNLLLGGIGDLDTVPGLTRLTSWCAPTWIPYRIGTDVQRGLVSMASRHGRGFHWSSSRRPTSSTGTADYRRRSPTTYRRWLRPPASNGSAPTSSRAQSVSGAVEAPRRSDRPSGAARPMSQTLDRRRGAGHGRIHSRHDRRHHGPRPKTSSSPKAYGAWTDHWHHDRRAREGVDKLATWRGSLSQMNPRSGPVIAVAKPRRVLMSIASAAWFCSTSEANFIDTSATRADGWAGEYPVLPARWIPEANA